MIIETLCRTSVKRYYIVFFRTAITRSTTVDSIKIPSMTNIVADSVAFTTAFDVLNHTC